MIKQAHFQTFVQFLILIYIYLFRFVFIDEQNIALFAENNILNVMDFYQEIWLILGKVLWDKNILFEFC